MRILVLDTYYPAFLASHYAARPGLADQAYHEQLHSLFERSFGTGDAYSHYLREQGHDATEIVANCEPLQRRWAGEQGRRFPTGRAVWRAPTPVGYLARRRLLRGIALTQVAAFDPQIVYVQDLWFFTAGDLDRLRRDNRFVVGQIASSLPAERLLRRYDLVLSSFPHFVETFRCSGLDSEYLKIAFDERVLDRLAVGDDDRTCAVSFVGGLDPAVHGERTRLLERLAGEVELSVWGYGAEALAPGSPLRGCYRGEAWGLDMYEVLARSRITLNRHIEHAGQYANNMRLYEATGVGALLVTEASRNLTELFQPGREVAAYKGEDDLIEQLRHYAGHGDERRRVAAAGQARTLSEHTYANRIADLATMLEARLK